MYPNRTENPTNKNVLEGKGVNLLQKVHMQAYRTNTYYYIHLVKAGLPMGSAQGALVSGKGQRVVLLSTKALAAGLVFYGS